VQCKLPASCTVRNNRSRRANSGGAGRAQAGQVARAGRGASDQPSRRERQGGGQPCAGAGAPVEGAGGRQTAGELVVLPDPER
jgi:hypothetical protein